MLDDIVTRLRRFDALFDNRGEMEDALFDAADEIERLRAEVERLQEVVSEYAKEVRGE